MDQHLAERLAHLEVGAAARAQAQAGDAAGQRHLLDQLVIDDGAVGDRPAGMVDAFVGLGVNRAHQVLVHHLGHEGVKGARVRASLTSTW